MVLRIQGSLSSGYYPLNISPPAALTRLLSIVESTVTWIFERLGELFSSCWVREEKSCEPRTLDKNFSVNSASILSDANESKPKKEVGTVLRGAQDLLENVKQQIDAAFTTCKTPPSEQFTVTSGQSSEILKTDFIRICRDLTNDFETLSQRTQHWNELQESLKKDQAAWPLNPMNHLLLLTRHDLQSQLQTAKHRVLYEGDSTFMGLYWVANTPFFSIFRKTIMIHVDRASKVAGAAPIYNYQEYLKRTMDILNCMRQIALKCDHKKFMKDIDLDIKKVHNLLSMEAQVPATSLSPESDLIPSSLSSPAAFSSNEAFFGICQEIENTFNTFSEQARRWIQIQEDLKKIDSTWPDLSWINMILEMTSEEFQITLSRVKSRGALSGDTANKISSNDLLRLSNPFTLFREQLLIHRVSSMSFSEQRGHHFTEYLKCIQELASCVRQIGLRCGNEKLVKDIDQDISTLQPAIDWLTHRNQAPEL